VLPCLSRSHTHPFDDSMKGQILLPKMSTVCVCSLVVVKQTCNIVEHEKITITLLLDDDLRSDNLISAIICNLGP